MESDMTNNTCLDLPITLPPYTTFSYLYGAGIPAMQNPNAKNWYFNHTVNLYCKILSTKVHLNCDVYLDTGDFWNMPFLERSVTNTRFLGNCIEPIIREMLLHGYYVLFSGVDDFYIPGKAAYQKSHLDLGGLIVGMDDNNEAYHIMTDTVNRRLDKIAVPKTAFQQALEYMIQNKQYGTLCALKTTAEKISLNLPEIEKNLIDYLNPVQTISEDQRLVYSGLEVYDALLLLFDALLDGTTGNDGCAFHSLWEHKKCMQKRMTAIEEILNIEHESSCAYGQVVTSAHHLYQQYNGTESTYQQNKINEAKIILMRMKENENKILSNFLKKTRTT